MVFDLTALAALLLLASAYRARVAGRRSPPTAAPNFACDHSWRGRARGALPG